MGAYLTESTAYLILLPIRIERCSSIWSFPQGLGWKIEYIQYIYIYVFDKSTLWTNNFLTMESFQQHALPFHAGSHDYGTNQTDLYDSTSTKVNLIIRWQLGIGIGKRWGRHENGESWNKATSYQAKLMPLGVALPMLPDVYIYIYMCMTYLQRALWRQPWKSLPGTMNSLTTCNKGKLTMLHGAPVPILQLILEFFHVYCTSILGEIKKHQLTIRKTTLK